MDQTLFHLINERWTNPALDLFMAAISNSQIWKPVFVVIVLIMVVFGGFKARACIICILLSLLVAEQFTGLLKTAFDRRRPKQVQVVRMVELQKTRPMFLTLFKEPEIRYSDQSDRNNSGPSFPSGHMTSNTVIAVCLTLFYRRRGALYWILAAGETLLILAVLELLWRWAGPRVVPALYDRHPSLIVAE